MKIRQFITGILMGLMLATGWGQQRIYSDSLPPLPAKQADRPSLGFAGMLGGVHAGAVIAAGGANFPDALPWKGGKKVWHNTIYVYENERWHISETRLTEPLAYGASISLPEGILCIGGENESKTSNQVFLISWDPQSREITLKNYPDLPEPLAYTAAVWEGDYIYVVGGKDKLKSTNRFFRLSLKAMQWEQLPDFPGPPRALHAVAVQDTPNSRSLFVMGGRNEIAGNASSTHSDFIAYDLKTGTWRQMGPILPEGKPRVIMGASAKTAGSMHLLLYGGSDEVHFNTLEQIALALQTENDPVKRQELIRKRDALLNNHPGFSRDILAYNTITNRWFTFAELPRPLPVTPLAFSLGPDFYIVSGETSPGIRSPKVWKFSDTEAIKPFGVINFTVLGGYLLISLLIGLYFSKKQKSTEDYFTGGGRIPWWAAGLSLFGTLLSAITFMAIPAKAFTTDWSFFMINMMAIAITPVIAYLFIPFFNRLKIATAYEFLENRFNYTTRALGSLSFILFQLGRIGVILLLPALAISVVTGIPVSTSILIMSVLCIAYTTFGGIEAVIWTDVLQVIVLLGGSILAIFWILGQVETPFSEIIAFASDQHKFNLADMTPDFTRATFWVVVLGGLASSMVTQGTDQTIVQRYLTAKDIRSSRKTLYTNAILTFPATLIFFGIGTLLFFFYSQHPQRLSPELGNNDALFPWYIVSELPVGISGLLVAGIFSAAMSSISSSLNSVATAFCNDFYDKFNPANSDLRRLQVARWATLITGVLGTGFALWMAHSNIKSLWDVFIQFLGLFTGGLGGLFLLGMLTKRANGSGALAGLAGSALVTAYISMFTPISFLLYSFVGVISCFILGYGFSIIFQKTGSS